MSISDATGFVSGLAAFGGRPRSSRLLHVGRPNIPDRAAVLARVGAALDRRWLSNDGPLVSEFEELVADRLGVRHCVAVSNATMGLSLAARAIGLTGDVIVPAFTFVATAHALAWQGARPVFCDVRRDSHQLDPECVERAITDQTTGILAAHTWGRPSDVSGLTAVAQRNGIEIMFDAAPAFGATTGGAFVGGFGRAEVVSFHATKVVSAGEGGAVLTNDDEVAARVRTMRSFGFVDNDQVVALGTNAKLSELAAAMGISSIEHFERFRDTNQRNFSRYRQALSGVLGVRVIPYDTGQQCNYHNVVVEVDAERTGITRDLVLQMLSAENVLARRYFYPGCHRMEPYRSQRRPTPEDFPVTDLVASQVLSLPTGTDMGPRDVEMVCELVAGLVEHGDEISERAEKLGLSPNSAEPWSV